MGKGPFQEFWFANNAFFDTELEREPSDYHAVVANLAFNKYFFGLETPTSQEVFEAYRISLENHLEPWPHENSLYYNDGIAILVLSDLKAESFDGKKLKALYESGQRMKQAFFNK